MLERLDSPPEFLGLFVGETHSPELVWGEVTIHHKPFSLNPKP